MTLPGVPESLTDPRWFLIAGAIFVLMALAGSPLRRLPISTSMVYLAAGTLLAPIGLGLLVVDPVGQARILELVSEIAVIVSLFTAGLKLRTPLNDPEWWLPVRLATISMIVTVALIAAVGSLALGLTLGAAILLGAILAPTDPVLASDVQLAHPHDRDRLRFTLTGEGALNDGTAFPFVMLGLGLLGLHDLGQDGLRWLAVDVVWAVVVGLATGFALGTLVGRLVVHLRSVRREFTGADDFLALGLISASYGTALLLGSYGFLAVFAAGLAVRRVERATSGDRPAEEVVEIAEAGRREEIATAPETAPAYLAHALLAFNEQLERVGEVVVVVLVGAALVVAGLPAAAVWFVPLLFLVLRPIAVVIGLVGAHISRLQLALTSWFGIRGIGSVYYLSFAITHGLPADVARTLASITLAAIGVSIVVHGVSVTPLMAWYEARIRDRDGARRTGEPADSGTL